MTKAFFMSIWGRRGSKVAGIFMILPALIAAVVISVLHQVNPTKYPNIGGHDHVVFLGELQMIFGLMAAIVVGAVVGSYDASQGTMRYLLLSGISRWKLYLSRTFALLVLYALILVPIFLLMLLWMAMPYSADEGALLSDVLQTEWALLMLMTCYGLLAMGVGSLLQSNGGAIAVSIVLNLGMLPVLAALEHWAPALADVMFPTVVDRVMSLIAKGDPSMMVSVAAVVGWLVIALGLGALRLQRSEY